MQNHESLKVESQKVWVAVDLGGTRLRMLAVQEHAQIQSHAKSPATILARVEKPSPFGLQSLVTALKSGFDDLRKLVQKQGFSLENALLMGSPGRFYFDAQGRKRIAPRTAVHLEKFPGEFNDLDIVAELARGLNLPEESVFVDNDAVVQGLYLIHQILDSPLGEDLRDEAVVCINPGTGLGGCVAQVNSDAMVTTFTDGHISEFLLGDWHFSRSLGRFDLQVRNVGLEPTAEQALNLEAGQKNTLWPALEFHLVQTKATSESATSTSSKSETEPPQEVLQRFTLASAQGKQAEDCISGSGLANIAKSIDNMMFLQMGQYPLQKAAAELELENVDGKLISTLLRQAKQDLPGDIARWIADFAGAATSRLIDLLCSGELQKGPGFPNWNDADLRNLKGLRRFVFGGGISMTPLGQWMLAEAQRLQAKYEERQFFHSLAQDEAGALGTLYLLTNKMK